MSKTSIGLLIMFIIILGVLLALNFAYTSHPELQSFPQKLFPTETVASENTLSITPNTINVSPGKPSTFQILIDSKGEKPTLIQMELSYSPSAISAVTVTPGTFFQNPNVLLNKVNANNGRISYAIGPLSGTENKTTSQVVATVKIIPRPNTIKRETVISFLPKTIVQTEQAQNTLKSAVGTKIKMMSGIALPATPSAGFMQY